MDSDRDPWLLIPEPVRRCPADLVAVVGLTILTVGVALLPVIRETPLRVLFGLPFVLFLPGYAFIAALFPEAGESPSTETDVVESDQGESVSGIRDRGIDGIERVALSFGLSIAIVPLIGLILNFTPWGIRLVPILVSVSGFTIGAAVLAILRRWELPEDERFAVPYRDWIDSIRSELFEPEDRTDLVLNVLLALSLILALGSVTYAIAVPPQGEQFTEFYILTTDDDGELVAADYPTEFEHGEARSIVIGIGNNEHETVAYTVVIQLQRVEIEDNETVVLERSELDRFSTTLPHDEEMHRSQEIVPDIIGEDLRLAFFLYVDSPPEIPTRENAYRDLHLWINVTAPTETETDPEAVSIRE